MLDVLEGGCSALQQRNGELAAALNGATNLQEGDVISRVVSSPKKGPSKTKNTTKRKSVKARRAATPKKGQLNLPMAANPSDDDATTPGETSVKQEEAANRGKRQALGMSFSKLRASIQARRAERRPDHEPEHEHTSN